MDNNEGFVEDSALVLEVNSGNVKFEMINNGSCESCGLHGVCGPKNRQIIHETETDLDLQKGDVIKVHLSAGVRIFSAFVLFLMPIIAMILFYLLAKFLFTWNEDFSILFSVFGLLASGIFIWAIDKSYSKKIHFEIIEIIKKVTDEN